MNSAHPAGRRLLPPRSNQLNGVANFKDENRLAWSLRQSADLAAPKPFRSDRTAIFSSHRLGGIVEKLVLAGGKVQTNGESGKRCGVDLDRADVRARCCWGDHRCELQGHAKHLRVGKSGAFGPGMRKKIRSAKPRPLLKPRPRGTNEQHLAGAPFRERGPSTASLVKSLSAQVGRFEEAEHLTLARRSSCQRPKQDRGKVRFSS